MGLFSGILTLPFAVGQNVLLLSNPLVDFMPQALQAFDLQLWQKKREWVQSGEAQQYRRTPIAQVPQASMRSTQRRVHWLTLSPCFSRWRFQPSLMVNRSLAGRGIYMKLSITWCSGHAKPRNGEAVTLAL